MTWKVLLMSIKAFAGLMMYSYDLSSNAVGS